MAAGLRRDVGKLGLLFAGVGSIIGSGWLFSALNAAHTAGPAAILSWGIGTVLILLIGLCFAALGTMFPISGGVVRFPHLSFGYTLTGLGGMFAIAGMAVFVILNDIGVKYFAQINNAALWPILRYSGKSRARRWTGRRARAGFSPGSSGTE